MRLLLGLDPLGVAEMVDEVADDGGFSHALAAEKRHAQLGHGRRRLARLFGH